MTSPEALNLRPFDSTRPNSSRNLRTSFTFEMLTPDSSAISLGVRALDLICAKTLVMIPMRIHTGTGRLYAYGSQDTCFTRVVEPHG